MIWPLLKLQVACGHVGMSKSIAVCCCECHNSLACLIVFCAALYQRPSISPAELNEFVYFASLLVVSSRVSKGTTIYLEGGGVMFFSKKYSDSQCCWKKYSDFAGGKKKSDSEFLSYKLMLNSGNKIRALRDKKKYSNSCVVRKNISERNKKPYPPPPSS